MAVGPASVIRFWRARFSGAQNLGAVLQLCWLLIPQQFFLHFGRRSVIEIVRERLGRQQLLNEQSLRGNDEKGNRGRRRPYSLRRVVCAMTLGCLSMGPRNRRT